MTFEIGSVFIIELMPKFSIIRPIEKVVDDQKLFLSGMGTLLYLLKHSRIILPTQL